MPRYSVWLVRMALLYLVLGFTLGALMLAREGAGWPPPAFEALRPLHAEVLLVGWVLQLAFGVANWILPFGRGHTERPLLLAVIGLLNGGVWMAGLSPLIFGSTLLPDARPKQELSSPLPCISGRACVPFPSTLESGEDKGSKSLRNTSNKGPSAYL